jgi:phage gp46-like protein
LAELKIRDGDYQRRGSGLAKVDGTEALLQRVLFKLTARRGAFPFVESLGSRLWQLGRIPAQQRQAAAMQYAAEALRDEGLTVEDVTLQERPDGTVAMTAALRGDGRQALSVTVNIR